MKIKNQRIENGKEITEYESGHVITMPDQTNVPKQKRIVSVGASELYDRFTEDEIIQILGSSSIYAKKLILELQVKMKFDLKSESLEMILEQLKTDGILTDERIDQILIRKKDNIEVK